MSRASPVMQAAIGGKQYSPGCSGRSHFGGERHPGRSVDGDGVRAFAADHFGVDAVAARVGEHFEEACDPTGLAQAARVRVVGGGSAEFLAGFDNALEEIFTARIDGDQAL